MVHFSLPGKPPPILNVGGPGDAASPENENVSRPEGLQGPDGLACTDSPPSPTSPDNVMTDPTHRHDMTNSTSPDDIIMTSSEAIFRTSRPEVIYDDVPCESLLSPLEGGDSDTVVCLCMHAWMHVCVCDLMSPLLCQMTSTRTSRGQKAIMAPTTVGATVSLRAMMSSQTARPKYPLLPEAVVR